MFVLQVLHYVFHYQPEKHQTGHFKVQICDLAVGILLRLELGGDAGRPFESKDSGCAPSFHAEYHAAYSFARGVHYSSHVRVRILYQLFNMSWFAQGVFE